LAGIKKLKCDYFRKAVKDVKKYLAAAIKNPGKRIT
jgi:hypothetical protein